MKQNVAIIAGGDSGEYEISIKSAIVVKNHLDNDRFDSYLIVIKGRDWNYTDEKGELFAVDKANFTVSLPEGRLIFEGVFIAIHGTPGEDGKIQSYFDLLGLPYTTCDQTTSALTFDKFFCNNFVRSFGINVSRSLIVKSDEKFTVEEFLKQISLPCFVKPNRGGSSVGISKVKTPEQLIPAIKLALGEDNQVMMEEFIPGREFSCGIVDLKGKVMALPITEIISKNEFFDYKAKYEKMADEITPADISDDIALKIQEVSLKLYHLLNCRGMVRIDYIMNGEKLYFLEVNTVPGLSERSILPQQALNAGISLQELFTETMVNALSRK